MHSIVQFHMKFHSFCFDKVIIRLMKEAILHGLCGWENNETNKSDSKNKMRRRRVRNLDSMFLVLNVL